MPQDLADEFTGLILLRVVEDRPRVADLDHQPVIHEDHPLRHLPHERHFMADDQHGHVFGNPVADTAEAGRNPVVDLLAIQVDLPVGRQPKAHDHPQHG